MVRVGVLLAVVMAVVATPVAGASGGEIVVDSSDQTDDEPTEEDGPVVDDPDDEPLPVVRGDGAVIVPGETIAVPTQAADATDVRKAFLKAKKAFHEGRQDIQSIKKGEAEPRDVPTFFGDDSDEDGEQDG